MSTTGRWARWACALSERGGRLAVLAGPGSAALGAALPAAVQDSTGAADAFVRAFSANWAAQQGPQRALAMGLAADVASVMHLMKSIAFDQAAHAKVQPWADACQARRALARALAKP